MNRPIAVALVAVCLLPVSAGGADEPSIFERTSTNLRAPETPAAAETAEASQRLGAAWLVSAQGADGGWGAGPAGQPGATHPSDVATTAYAVLALTRDALGSSRHLEARTKGITFVVKAIENAPEGPRLATPSGTQPQNKLGPLVDTHFAAQMLGQVHDTLPVGALKTRAGKAYDLVLAKVQQSQGSDGSFDRGGWASQLSSGVATEALEVAKAKQRDVDDRVLERAQQRNEQVANLGSEDFDTTSSAGVALYSAATTVRSAKKAKDRLQASGGSTASAEAIGTKGAQAAGQSGVLAGFGSTGGEENLSYNMIADTLAEEGGAAWVQWNDNISKTLMSSQNADGSWVGHHCITSPVFVTAGAVMTLSAGPWATHQKTLAGADKPTPASFAK